MRAFDANATVDIRHRKIDLAIAADGVVKLRDLITLPSTVRRGAPCPSAKRKLPTKPLKTSHSSVNRSVEHVKATVRALPTRPRFGRGHGARHHGPFLQTQLDFLAGRPGPSRGPLPAHPAQAEAEARASHDRREEEEQRAQPRVRVPGGRAG